MGARVVGAAAVLAAAAAAGCGASSDAPRAGSPDTPRAASLDTPRAAAAPVAARHAGATGSAVTVVRSQFGRILGDGRGQALYYFSRERGRTSRCYGVCAQAWPPASARGKPVAARGARQPLIGTTVRRDGTRQLTYAGHPVYLYVGDSPGRVLCHDVTEFGGVWRAIRADGSAVR